MESYTTVQTTSRWINSLFQNTSIGNAPELGGGPRPPVSDSLSMDPRGGMSYPNYKPQMVQPRGHQAIRSLPAATRASTHASPQAIRATSKSNSRSQARPSPQSTSRPSPHTNSRPSPQASHRSSSQTSSRPSPQASHRPSPQTSHRPSPQTSHRPSPQASHRPSPQTSHRPSPQASHRPSPQTSHRPSPQASSRPSPQSSRSQAMRAGKPSPQTVRRSAASTSRQGHSSSGVINQSPPAHSSVRPGAHVQASLHGHMQRQQQAGALQGQQGPLAYPQTTRSELFHFHTPPSSHTMSPTREKHPIPSRSSASTGEMPLDLSRQAPLPSAPPSSKGTPKSLSSSLDSPLDLSGKGIDLSGKGSGPIHLGKTISGVLINVQKCSFCNASFSTVPFLKLHLGKCPRKPKSLTSVDIERWIENNFPDAGPSSTSPPTSETHEQASEDVRDSLPRVNGAVALGTICIKEEPVEEEISIIDIEPMGKSADKSAYKGSAKKSNTTSKPTNSDETPASSPSKGYIKYACIYCDNTYDKKEVLQEHIKTIHSANITLTSAQPVITPAEPKSPETEPGKADKKDEKETSASAKTKSPEVQPSGTDSKGSSTPTKSTEKKQVKRPTGNIRSIADTLLRRMTEKTQHTDKTEPVPPEETPKTPSPAEEEAPSKPTTQQKEPSTKESAELTSGKECEKETKSKQVEDVTQNNSQSEEEVESPKKISTKKQSPVKATKSGKKSPEKAKSKGKATSKSQKKSETKPVETPTKTSGKREEVVRPVRVTRESRHDAIQPAVETPSAGKKVRETNKKSDTEKSKSEKSESTPKTVKTPLKGTQGKESEPENRTEIETQAKSPTKKVPKGEKMTREKVADIARLALDMGCLRRSPRASKAASGLPSPSQLVADVVAEVQPPNKKVKGGKPAEETPTSHVKKATKRGADDTPVPHPAKKRKQEELLEEEAEVIEEEEKSPKSKVKSKSTKQSKGKKVGKQEAVKAKKSEDLKKVNTQDNERKEKTSDENPTIDIPKVKTVKGKGKEVGKGKITKSRALQEQEMEAVEELMKLSRGEARTEASPTKSSQEKIDEVYNRHVAAIKGKVTKKGRNKKNKQSTKDPDEAEKVARIVGRKAYKEWLEIQSTNVKDVTDSIVKKTAEAKQAKDKKKKKYEEDDDYFMDDDPEEEEMEGISDGDEEEDKEEFNDETWEPKDKSKPGRPKHDQNIKEFDLECSKCKGRVTGRKDFNVHIYCHGPSILACPVCAQEFRNRNRCWGHMGRVHAGIKNYHECPYCYKRYCRRDAVQVHVASVHPKERRRELAEKNGMQQQEEEEEEEFKDEDVDVDLTCKRCNRPIQNKADCYTHIMLHSPRGKRKVCPLCDKTFKDSSRVWEHIMVEHAGIKPFGCDQCAFRCAHEENLKKHIQTFHGKFLDPVARVKMDFESENWDLGLNPSYLQEPQGPLPLSSGNVISLIDLSLNTLIINQRTKVINLNLLLSGQNIDLKSIINEALGTNSKDASPKSELKDGKAKNENGKSEENNNGNELEDSSEGIYPDDPAVIASRDMIPADCADMELPCVLCPMGVKGPEEFKLHVLKHICDSTRVCPVCRRAFSRKSSCRRHLVEHTFKWHHKCHLCSQTFPKPQYLEKHYPKHFEQGFQCLNCLGKFESEELLWMHIHPDRPLALRDAPLGPADNVKFSCRRVHVCEKCHQEFRSAWGLQYHRENTHSEGVIEDEKPFICTTCGKRFKSNITLRNHREIHMEDCSYLCRHCSLTCRTKRQLQKHIEYKHMEKIYKCSYCPKMFATRSRLKEHAIMHQNKTFICDICGKVYRHQRVFETHCRQHIKPPVKKHRLFPCPQCTHQSKSKEQLNLHMRRHTGERPYKCKECPKAFSSQTGLWRHQMSHAGRKPHECHLCKKTFVQKCSLDRHLLSHAGIKPYRCEYCGAEYSQSYPLTKHMEKKHPGMPFIIIKKDVDPIVIEPSQQQEEEEEQEDSPDNPTETVTEVAAETAKRVTAEALESLPGVDPEGNQAERVTSTDDDDQMVPEDEPKELLSV